jgi:hypothetical protein
MPNKNLTDINQNVNLLFIKLPNKGLKYIKHTMD